MRDQTDPISAQRKSPSLVIGGLALAHPHVGQGVYTLRLIEGLLRVCPGDVLVLAPYSVPRPAVIPAENFLNLPRVFTTPHPVIAHAIVSHQMLRYTRQRFPRAVFHSPGPILGRTKPARTIVTLHDCLYRHFSNYDGRFFLRRILLRGTERFAARANLVLTDSKFSRDDLIAQAGIPEGKIRIVYPWVGNDFFAPIPSEAVEQLRAKNCLPMRFWLYLGGFDCRKNIEFLLAAYAAAARERTLPPLVLAGKIPAARHPAHCDVLGTIARLQLTDEQVICPGMIAAADLAALYRAAALLIYPSLMEGFGLPPAEAMAVGTPVLTSHASSLPEVVRNTHCHFDPKHLPSLTAKLTAASSDERQFLSELPSAFTERHGINQYLEAIRPIRESRD